MENVCMDLKFLACNGKISGHCPTDDDSPARLEKRMDGAHYWHSGGAREYGRQ